MPVLDHIFCFVDPDGRDIEEAARAGFLVDRPHDHVGQGTSCRCAMFPEHYLEWIYVRDRSESEAGPLRLDRRADWRITGACPFGIGLRGPPAVADRASFRAYKRTRWAAESPPLLVHELAWDPSPLPMLFTFEGWERHRIEDMPPRAWPRLADGHAFAHPHRPQGFTAVTIDVPTDVPPALARPAPSTTIRRGPRFHLDVTLAAEPFAPIALFDGLMTIRSDGSLVREVGS